MYIRLEQLDAVLTGHVKRGEKNAKLLDDYGVALIDRVNQLEQDGVLLSDAVDQVAEEVAIIEPNVKNGNVEQRETEGQTDLTREYIDHLKQENEFLRQELDRTLGLVQETQAMLPKDSAARNNGKMSRWRHLKAVFAGR